MAQFCWDDISSESDTANKLNQSTSPKEAMAHTGSKTDDDVNHRGSIFVARRNVEEEPAGPDVDFNHGSSRNVEEEPAGPDDEFNESETSENSSQSTYPVEEMAHNGSDGYRGFLARCIRRIFRWRLRVPLSTLPEYSFDGDIRWQYDQESFTVISKKTEENERFIEQIGLQGNNDGSVAALLKDIFSSAYYQLSIRRLPLPSSTISEDVLLHNGRYKKDFEEPQPIGEGGFGVVTQVKNNVDNQHYAVKMVKFKSNGITWEKFSREVTILAKLTNTHSHRIVRYHTAWLEEKDFSEPDTTESDDGGSHSSKPLTKYVLYIQMELCGKTLLKWLEDRNQKDCEDLFKRVDHTTNIQILKQILEGISFLHEKGIWHRDLKPANIFLTESQLDVKIGDFGLAREVPCQEEENVEAVNPRPGGDQLFTFVGTYPYTAPEQLTGSVYDSKADMYSFGIIKYEMFLPYKSLTETKESIEVLRKDEVIQEKELISKWPEEAKLIKSLTNMKKLRRPSASDVLKNKAYSDHNQQTQLSQRDSVIIEKEKELEKVKEESYKELRKVKEDRDKELEKVKEERDQELEKVKADRDKELEKVKADRDKELEKVKEERDKELKKVKEDRDKELEKLKEDRDKELEKVKEDRDKVKEERDKVEEDMDKDWWWFA